MLLKYQNGAPARAEPSRRAAIPSTSPKPNPKGRPPPGALAADDDGIEGMDLDAPFTSYLPLCATEDDLINFYRAEASEGRDTIIVKPCRGVGSDGVFKCETAAECRAAFDALRATTRYGGGFNDVVLAQAFLAGVEYAVDSVSRDGEHKVTALWRYDKRPANGGAFVYRGTWLADAAGAGAVLETLRACLDALGHANGPAHSELIVGDDGAATLVEVNARFHNANVRPLVAACVAACVAPRLLMASMRRAKGERPLRSAADLASCSAASTRFHAAGPPKAPLLR